MGLFSRKPHAPAFGASEPIRAAAGSAGRPGLWQNFTVGASTARALSIPTVSRAVGLITSTIGGLDLRQYTLQWDPAGERYEKIYLEGESWFTRPDPHVTRNFIMSATVKDLMLHGRAFWYITTRFSTNFPASFVWLPADQVSTPDQSGPEWFGPATKIEFNGQKLDPSLVVQFLSPLDGMLWTGSRAIDIAYRLDEAARRYANSDIPSGYLQQRDNSEPLSGDELTELAQAWANARSQRAVGALNNSVEWVESRANPSTLQLHEGRQHAALELARVCQVPAWLVGLSVGGMTYQNSEQARQDLILFGAMPYIRCIEETLSLDTVIPRGRHIEFDVDDYLGGAAGDAIPVEGPVTQEGAPA